MGATSSFEGAATISFGGRRPVRLGISSRERPPSDDQFLWGVDDQFVWGVDDQFVWGVDDHFAGPSGDKFVWGFDDHFVWGVDDHFVWAVKGPKSPGFGQVRLGG